MAFAIAISSAICVSVWLTLRPQDPTFRGKPESQWIANLTYNDDEQVKLWREFGPDGVRVLIRGLEKADKSLDRAYRGLYRRMAAVLPANAVGLLPDARMDSTRSIRMRIVSLLSSLGHDAKLATPAMVQRLRDEDPNVRALAITFFAYGENADAPLNQMDAKLKRKLLPEFLAALDYRGEAWSVKNNALVALRYYRDQPDALVPALVKALDEPNPQVRDLVVGLLTGFDPALLAQPGTFVTLVRLLQHSNEQVACRAAELLGKIRNEPTLAIGALIQAARSTNAYVARAALEALGNFPKHPETIVPVLIKSLQRPEDLVRWSAAASLKSIDPVTAANAGIE